MSTTPPLARSGLALIALALGLAASLLARAQDDAGAGGAVELSVPAPWTDAEGATRSPAVYPPQELPLRFFHDRHVAGESLQMACVECHAQAPLSTRTADRLLPPMALCLDCHVLGEPVAQLAPHQVRAECHTCHPGFAVEPPVLPPELDRPGAVDATTAQRVLNPPPRAVIPPANLHFSHRRHADAAVDCVECHGSMAGVELATRDNLPTMAQCLDCHDARDVPGQEVVIGPEDCASCHLTSASGRLRTDFASGTLAPTGRFRPDDHRPDTFALETHGAVAAADEALCLVCHTHDDCAGCHDGVIKPFALHPPNYVQTHGIDALGSANECTSCHTVSDFCVGCHEQTGVGDFARPPLGARLHPPGFVDEPSSPDFHGPIARLDMTGCVSCHQEDTCIGCHAGIDPHPPGFAAECGAMLERNATPCAKCHLDLGRLRGLCR